MDAQPTVVIVNGEREWADVFPDAQVRHCRLQTAQWQVAGQTLYLLHEQGRTRVDGLLWRVGAIRPDPRHRVVLDLIRLTRTPCVNPAATLQRGFDRLSMRAEMQAIGLPLLPQEIILGSTLLDHTEPTPPAVLKIGNYHAGYGKALITARSDWPDLRDLTWTADDYVTLEPFVDYVRDLRCLAVGNDLWAMKRRSESWKANRDTQEYSLTDPPAELAEYTRAAMAHLGADILGLDFLEDREGRFFLLETNDVPGLTGFPTSIRHTLARRLMEQISR
ncbi:hypothetical protein GCM10008959_36870 [Deinococcus seoulensis]|uniref:ATP-grasp domain-containing protein n=1 Tax=Deinococcus seoulensis TaxID=1837379 RepID=A0ABQ2RVR2_9DEIO|nr:hypothetical protein [Deinococcus seoulensis]GGR71913.1 hypothetical protein GCM10008959_36870 [Deinococcus seoulensis]